jgi:hypothetical protein
LLTFIRIQITVGPGYQVPFADEIRKSLTSEEREKIRVSAVGLITNGKQAEEILQKGQSDVVRPLVSPPSPTCADLGLSSQVSVAREFLRHADLVFDWAQELNIVVNVPVEYQRSQTRTFHLIPFPLPVSFAFPRPFPSRRASRFLDVSPIIPLLFTHARANDLPSAGMFTHQEDKKPDHDSSKVDKESGQETKKENK